MSDPIADMLARIRNGQKAHKAQVVVRPSKLAAAVLGVLKSEGYIRGFADRETRPGHREIIVDLKYYEGAPAIREIERVSRPGRRAYAGATVLPRAFGGLGIAIVSTPQGVMSDSEARTKHIRGEIIARVY
jgi:small subunit ribosomal protein S8